MPAVTEQVVRRCAEASSNRYEFWVQFLRSAGATQIAEIGVLRGDFAARLLADCERLSRYYMLDPWRHLESWNKPANTSNEVFERYFQETIDKTQPYEAKRVMLRGTTTEVIDEIADGALDFAYVDGDHTLRGIAIDLLRVFPKVRTGGWIGGDDFCRSIWQHAQVYEPTLVFPYAVYFAEAVGARIYALPHNQFLMEKSRSGVHQFVDLTGAYADGSLKDQLSPLPAPLAHLVGISGLLRTRARLLHTRLRRRPR